MELSASDLAVLAFTSGSTQAPRAVELTHGNILANLQGLLQVRRAEANDVILSLLPPAHLFELVVGQLGPIACGAKICYAPVMIPNRILEALRSEGITIAVVVPALLRLLIQENVDQLVALGEVDARWSKTSDNEIAANLRTQQQEAEQHPRSQALRAPVGSTLKSVVIGGAAINPAWESMLGSVGIRLEIGYGLTESSPIVSMGFAGQMPQGSVGKVLPGSELKITETGEVLVKGPSVMGGYYRNPEESARIIENGWLHTGDLGRMDEQGNLFILGRLKEAMVNEGGETIYPEEVEPLYRMDELLEYCVVPFRSEHANDIPVLVGVPKANPLQDPEFAKALLVAFRAAKKSAPGRLKVSGLLLLDQAIPRTNLAKPKRLDLARGIEKKMAGIQAANNLTEDLWKILQQQPNFVN